MVVGPNHDPWETEVWQAINRFPHIGTSQSLPHATFVRYIAHAAVMVGNSSAGIREACYFGTPVVNVGSRQNGRLRGHNVLSAHNPIERVRTVKVKGYGPASEVYSKTEAKASPILQRINQQLAHGPYHPQQLYGDGTAGAQIAEILATVKLPPIQKRMMY